MAPVSAKGLGSASYDGASLDMMALSSLLLCDGLFWRRSIPPSPSPRPSSLSGSIELRSDQLIR